MKYKCDCGLLTTNKSDFRSHVEWHQQVEQEQQEYEEFQNMNPTEQQYQISRGWGKY